MLFLIAWHSSGFNFPSPPSARYFQVLTSDSLLHIFGDITYNPTSVSADVCWLSTEYRDMKTPVCPCDYAWRTCCWHSSYLDLGLFLLRGTDEKPCPRSSKSECAEDLWLTSINMSGSPSLHCYVKRKLENAVFSLKNTAHNLIISLLSQDYMIFICKKIFLISVFPLL